MSLVSRHLSFPKQEILTREAGFPFVSSQFPALSETGCYCGGPTEIGFGAVGAVGAVSPGITGAAVITPVAASVMLIP